MIQTENLLSVHLRNIPVNRPEALDIPADLSALSARLNR